MKSFSEVSQGKFISSTELVKSLAQSKNLHLSMEEWANHRLLMHSSDNYTSEEEATNTHNFIQRYFPALCNFQGIQCTSCADLVGTCTLSSKATVLTVTKPWACLSPWPLIIWVHGNACTFCTEQIVQIRLKASLENNMCNIAWGLVPTVIKCLTNSGNLTAALLNWEGLISLLR